MSRKAWKTSLVDLKRLTKFIQIVCIDAHVSLLQLDWLISVEVRALNLSLKGSETLKSELCPSKK